MFSHATDASKVALVHLVARMKQCRLSLLDTQFITDHLKAFGAIEIPAKDYLKNLEEALESDAKFKGKLPEKESRLALKNLLLA